MLNLGCGSCYHPDWTNVDFVSNTKSIIAHNLRKGIPFDSNHFDVVYHSHLLEHFPKSEAPYFISECYRVLKSGGIIRVVIPDLENIIREYLDKLEKSLAGDEKAKIDYEWIMLELFDQMVRNYSGGQMAEYFIKKEIPNSEYIYNRIGQEGQKIRKQFIDNLDDSSTNRQENNLLSFLKKFLSLHIFFRSCVKQKDIIKIGTFRLSGEVHQWMYDRYSIGKLLENAGFKDIKVTTAKISYIENWNSYFLDCLHDGTVRKPDSLFIEAKK
jgi:predicted SAM-dependent methyltransferase